VSGTQGNRFVLRMRKKTVPGTY